MAIIASQRPTYNGQDGLEFICKPSYKRRGYLGPSVNVSSQASIETLPEPPTVYEWASPEPAPQERRCFNVFLMSRKQALIYLDEDGISLHHEDNLRKTWIPYTSLKEVSVNKWDTCRVVIKTKLREFTVYTRNNECHILAKAAKHRRALFKKAHKKGQIGDHDGRPSQEDAQEMPAAENFAITARTMKWWDHPTPAVNPAA